MPLFVIVIHIIVCLALIMIVLLQTGKGADMGAAFGGGSSNTLFGATGASSFLSKMTTAVAVIFMLTSLILAYTATKRTSSSVLKDQPAVQQPATETQTTPPAEAPPQSTSETTTETAPSADTPAPTGQPEEPKKTDQ